MVGVAARYGTLRYLLTVPAGRGRLRTRLCSRSRATAGRGCGEADGAAIGWDIGAISSVATSR